MLGNEFHIIPLSGTIEVLVLSSALNTVTVERFHWLLRASPRILACGTRPLLLVSWVGSGHKTRVMASGLATI